PAVAAAQQATGSLPKPTLLTVFPPGGQAGTAVEVTLTGQDLENPEGLHFSHPGLKAEYLPPPPPPPPDPKKPPPAPMKAAPAPIKFKVTIAADVPVGLHDVRLVNKFGVSNPRVFAVGDQPEVPEKEPNNDV